MLCILEKILCDPWCPSWRMFSVLLCGFAAWREKLGIWGDYERKNKRVTVQKPGLPGLPGRREPRKPMITEKSTLL